MLFVIVDGSGLVGLVVDLGPITLVGLVADIVWLVLNIVGLTIVEVVGLVGLVMNLAGLVVAWVEPVWLAIGQLVGVVVDLGPIALVGMVGLVSNSVEVVCLVGLVIDLVGLVVAWLEPV